ncbi:MAG TPA: CBS domain-containing protein [Devosiaceae bacterium]|jgi:CBS domain-containing protein
MYVDNILQAKGAVVHTVSADARLGDAVKVLNAHNIGAVVVTARNGDVAGMLSERDVVRQLGKDPTGALLHLVGDCMSTKVITCSRDTTVAMLMERMTRFRIRHIPVVEDGELIGIVSIGDVVKRKIEETEQEATALRDYIASTIA